VHERIAFRFFHISVLRYPATHKKSQRKKTDIVRILSNGNESGHLTSQDSRLNTCPHPIYFNEEYLPAVKENGIIVHPEWRELVSGLRGMQESVVYLLGAIDTGKSTLCRFLVNELSREAVSAYLDCDTGQSTIGPPATVGLALYEEGNHEPFRTALRFVGSTSPSGHLIQEMAGTSRLLQLARESDASFIIIDSPGWVNGLVAGEFHIRMIDLLDPCLLLAVAREDELDPILANFTGRPGMQVRTLAPSLSVKTRSRSWRTWYRSGKFQDYFSPAVRWEMPIEGIGFHGRVPETFREEAWRGLLIGVCDREMLVLALGIVESLDLVRGIIRFRAPLGNLDDVSSIQVGSVHLDPATGIPQDYR
jgi:polynucleotide 5'-hydroxyl-kinase GRC3/NOL9